MDIDGTAGSCSGDSLRLQRVDPANMDLCGTSTTIQTFFSIDREMIVVFRSDASVNRGGFYFRVQGKLNI